MLRLIKKIISGPVDWFLYTIISDEQRKKISSMFSKRQRETIKRLISGKNHLLRKELKQIKYHLYNLGFTDRGLQDLKDFYQNMKHPDMKRLAAWELTLWYANQYSEEDAKTALEYLQVAKNGETKIDQLRRISIIEAECYDVLGQQDKGIQVLEEMLERQKHADLFLARANLEEQIEGRLVWINKVMDLFGLQPIYFESTGETTTYDDLRTKEMDREITDGPKVSVILPAFKAEVGIQIAIESILSQTWRNLELIVVDDCSPDNTAQVIQSYVEKDSRVTLLSTPQNSGPYVARNIGLQAATGEFVTINDADDWSHAEKIERQVKHLIENPNIIANTSAHSRLTEDLKLYRRGTPGKYIFPNMSSMMFRREIVMEKIGFWDSVRFAADGEFKRRFLKEFGASSFQDLDSGPLSLPRQSVQSLTSSSAFGYNGFFMGVRKEYVESLEFYHNSGKSLYYSYPMEKRPFPVPEPMWPKREDKVDGVRNFDVVIASDFRLDGDHLSLLLKEIEKQKNTQARIGLVQIYQYDLQINQEVNSKIRKLIDGEKVQMIVYGEKIKAESLIIVNPKILEEAQRYIPEIDAENVSAIINQMPIAFSQAEEQMEQYFQKLGIWYPVDESIREQIQTENLKLQLADENWVNLNAKQRG